MSKYRSKKITRDGMTFDSKREYQRWCELRLLERAGKINNLQRQVKFELLPSQRVDGKVVERACHYVADFAYYLAPQNEADKFLDLWSYVVEDTKGFKTKDYIIKRKLMLWVHGIRIKEV